MSRSQRCRANKNKRTRGNPKRPCGGITVRHNCATNHKRVPSRLPMGGPTLRHKCPTNHPPIPTQRVTLRDANSAGHSLVLVAGARRGANLPETYGLCGPLAAGNLLTAHNGQQIEQPTPNWEPQWHPCSNGAEQQTSRSNVRSTNCKRNPEPQTFVTNVPNCRKHRSTNLPGDS